MKHHLKHFKDGDVELDGNEFAGCTFERCQLMYYGGGPPRSKNRGQSPISVNRGQRSAVLRLCRDSLAWCFPTWPFTSSSAAIIDPLALWRTAIVNCISFT